MARGLGCIIAGTTSGCGKTLVTLGLLAALRERGRRVGSAKIGPDYIDGRFHAIASDRECLNLDHWSMSTGQIQDLAERGAWASDLLVIEGTMGLFDGAQCGGGSTADVAALLGLPVILVVDASGQGRSAGALISGFRGYRDDIVTGGVIFNRVGSVRHAEILGGCCKDLGVRVVGFLPWREDLSLPSRHLGLVQAGEIRDCDVLCARAGKWVAEHMDVDALFDIGCPVPGGVPGGEGGRKGCLPPLGQHMAIARDDAFSFIYDHLLLGWRDAGASLSFFSPLADEVPDPSANAIFLPGGYPELYAGPLSQCRRFMDGLRGMSERALIYGECGGFMVLGEGIMDREGKHHGMAGLLPVTTGFSDSRLSLGYREVCHEGCLPWPRSLRGHEFHYARVVGEGGRADGSDFLFRAWDSMGVEMSRMGRRAGRVMGSYMHIVAAPCGGGLGGAGSVK